MARRRQSFSDQLRRLLIARGESLAAISRATGVNHGALSRFLRRERGLSTRSLDRLFRYLGAELRATKRKGAG